MKAREAHLCVFAPIQYTYLRQRPQQLADEFRTLGYVVTYVEPCGFAATVRGGFWKMLLILARSAGYYLLGILAMISEKFYFYPMRGAAGRSKPGDFVVITLPLLIPHTRVDSPLLEKVNASVCRQALLRAVFPVVGPAAQSIGLVEQPFWGRVLKRGDFGKIFYDCLDEIRMFSGKSSADRFTQHESALIALSSGIFVTARSLEQDLRMRAPEARILRVPNGVDYTSFTQRAKEAPRPADLEGVRKPVAGYVGTIAEWMDIDLVREVAKAIPDISIVFVGPASAPRTMEALQDLTNFHWLDRKDYPEMPAYIRAFDICLIPFTTGGLSRTTNPVKIFEYFALGKPVVTTDLYELRKFSRLLYIARDTKSFISRVRAALEERDPKKRSLRIATAKENSWAKRAQAMNDSFAASGHEH